MDLAPRPPATTLAERLESSIRAGILGPGTRLPSTAAMAREHGVTVHAMQGALSQLCRRGLLLRKRRSGTVVARHADAAVLGVVMGGNVLVEPHLRVYGMVLHHLSDALAEAGFQIRLYLPDGAGMPGAMGQDLAAGRLRAVLALDLDPADVLPPGADPLPVLAVPWPDYEAIAYQGARHLLATGARRIAALPPIPSPDRSPANGAFRAGLDRALAEAGAPDSAITLLPGGNREPYGHQAVAALADHLPDAWLVADDNTTRGVVSALLLRGVRLPGGCRVATHANRGIDPFPPLALTRLEVDPRAAARAVVANLRAHLDGRTPPVPTLCPTLIPGDC